MYKLFFFLISCWSFSAFSVEFDNEPNSSDGEPKYAPYVVVSNSEMEPQNLTSDVSYPLSMAVTNSGKYVLFQVVFDAQYNPLVEDNLGDGYFLKNTETNETTRLGWPPGVRKNMEPTNVTMSPNGRYIGLSYNTGSENKAVVWDRLDNTLSDVIFDGAEMDKETRYPFIRIFPINKRYVYFRYVKHGVGDIYGVSDLESKTSKIINKDINGNFALAATAGYARFISDDGRYLIYQTYGAQMDEENISEKASTTLYLYDNLRNKHSKISPLNNYNFFSGASISPDGKYIIFSAPRPSSQDGNKYYKPGYYVIIYNIVTKEYEYVKDPKGKLIVGAEVPSISNNGDSIAFITENKEYLSNTEGAKYQVIFYDRINQKMVHTSISQITGKGTNQSLQRVVVYANGKGLLWTGDGSSPLVSYQEGNRRIYTLGFPTSPQIPKICEPYIN